MSKPNVNSGLHVAVVSHETIQGLINGQDVPMSLDDARSRINGLRKYELRKAETPCADSIEIWIKGFELSEPERSTGYVGNFAKVEISHISDTVNFVRIVKVPEDISKHPQRKYVTKHAHPNSGHPVLRAVRLQKVYESVEAAASELDLLQRQFPAACRRQNRRLILLHVWKGRDNGGVKKCAIRVSEADGVIRLVLTERQVRIDRVRCDEAFFVDDAICDLVLNMDALRVECRGTD